MIKVPSLRRALATCLAPLAIAGLVACGGKKEEKKAESFPPSVTAPSDNVTSTLPAPDVVAEPEPAVEPDEPVSEPEVVPTDYAGFIAAGKAKLAAGDSAKALEMFTKASELKDYAYPKIQMARALLQMGDHDNARVHAEKAVDMDATSSFAWNTLGRVELAAGDSEAAITSFEHAVNNDETNSYAWNNLGFALINLERWQEAAEALENATSSAKPKAYMFNNLAIAYEHLDMLDEARAAYRSASELGSEKAGASLIRLEGVKSIKVPAVDEATDIDGAEVEIDGAEVETDSDPVTDGDPADLNDAIVGC